jgi:serine/threonine protein kinase
MEPGSPFDAYLNGAMSSDDLISEVTRIMPNPAAYKLLITKFEAVCDRIPVDLRTKLEGLMAQGKTFGDPNEPKDEQRSYASVGINTVLQGRFVLEQELGRGGVGRVYRALDLRRKEANDREPFVALKLIDRKSTSVPEAMMLLQREAKKAQSLSHPSIVRTFDFDRDGDVLFITMELLDGVTLEEYLNKNPDGAPLEMVQRILSQVSSALDFAHSEGILHSDLKPSNIFLLRNGRTKVIDFGIARAIPTKDRPDPSVTVFDVHALHAMTPAYASVEMFEHAEPDARDDVFALACITYVLLTGRHQFYGLLAVVAE